MTTVQDAFNQQAKEKEVDNEVIETPTKDFNFQDYVISQEPTRITIEIPDTKESFEITYKDLSWSRRNQILSRSIQWSDSGSTSFDGDAYVRACLKEMIIEAPWGRTTEAFLLSIDGRLGSVLEDLVPKAFDQTPLSEADTIKKE